MDKRDFSAADVLTAVQTINHHVKDLQKLAKYWEKVRISKYERKIISLSV